MLLKPINQCFFCSAKRGPRALKFLKGIVTEYPSKPGALGGIKGVVEAIKKQSTISEYWRLDRPKEPDIYLKQF